MPRTGSLRSGTRSQIGSVAAQNILGAGQSTRSQRTAAAQVNKQNQVVMTIDELARIKQSCQMTKDNGDAEERTRDRVELQAKSKARVAAWPNTIDALRKKKDEERIRRLEEEEIERRKIDAHEDGLAVQ